MAAKGGCSLGHTPARKGVRKKEIQVTSDQALPRLCEEGSSSALRFCVVQGEVKQLEGEAAPTRLAALAGPVLGRHQLQPQPHPTPSWKQPRKAQLPRWPWGEGGWK